MELNELKPNFHMPFADLEQLGDEAVSLINRDATELLKYGVDTVKRDLIAQITQQLKNTPTDEELLGDVMIKTRDKDLLADQVKVGIRDVMIRVKNTFGKKSPEYEKFGADRLSKLTDNNLQRNGKRIVRIATIFLPQLQAKGLTQTELDNMSTLLNDFDTAIDEKEDAVKERDFAAKKRVELGNELYALIVEVYDYGKTYWVTRDESKYNDYIIYNGPSGGEPGKINSDCEATDDLDIEVSMVGKMNATAQVKVSDGALRKMIFDGTSLVTFNHTFSIPGNYNIGVTGDLIDVLEYHSNNSSLTTFNIPDDAVNIHTYALQGNKYTTPTVDGILVRVNSFGTPGVLISLADNAPPSAVGLAAKAELESRGWTVIVSS